MILAERLSNLGIYFDPTMSTSIVDSNGYMFWYVNGTLYRCAPDGEYTGEYTIWSSETDDSSK